MLLDCYCYSTHLYFGCWEFKFNKFTQTTKHKLLKPIYYLDFAYDRFQSYYLCLGDLRNKIFMPFISLTIPKRLNNFFFKLFNAGA